MELRIENGRYADDGRGALETVTGAEELAQRLTTRLRAKRGLFGPDPELGSRLYLLPRVRPSERAAAIKQYVAEAVAPEKGVELESFEFRELEGGVFHLSLRFAASGGGVTLDMEV